MTKGIGFSAERLLFQDARRNALKVLAITMIQLASFSIKKDVLKAIIQQIMTKQGNAIPTKKVVIPTSR